ncbi:MAG: hypothetical protein Q9M18_07065 [Mariprofundaceae bacterium]|nr:hypothetical protein [Mariprofundaceae bacterium]
MIDQLAYEFPLQSGLAYLNHNKPITAITKPKHEPAIPFDMLDIHKAYRCFLSESDRSLPQLERLFRTGIFLLRSKKNNLWKEVSKQGMESLPNWKDWLEPDHKIIHV